MMSQEGNNKSSTTWVKNSMTMNPSTKQLQGYDMPWCGIKKIDNI